MKTSPKILGNPDHLRAVTSGLKAFSIWRLAHPEASLDLRGFNLDKTDLSGFDLSCSELGAARPNEQPVTLCSAKLRGAILRESHLRMADLSYADLRDADLSDSQCSIIDFSWADLRGANLRGSYFIATNFHQANLAGAHFDGSTFGHTRFSTSSLSRAKGLSSVKHSYPSSIDVAMLTQPGKSLPESFLKGCGVAASLIKLLPAIHKSMDPVQFNSCFISFSYVNHAFAKKLHSRLDEAGVRVWFAPEDMQGGKKLVDQIDRAIVDHDLLLLILSPASMQSDWVVTEIKRALSAQKKTGQRKLFPIRICDMDALKSWTCFDADSGKDLAAQVREYFIPDFSSWKKSSEFAKGLNALLRDLRASA